MGYQFKVRPHALQPGSEMIEVWRDGHFVAAVYPHEDGIRVVSKYMTNVHMEEEEEDVAHAGQWLPVAIVMLEQ